jgi:CBS domain-containing protein
MRAWRMLGALPSTSTAGDRKGQDVMPIMESPSRASCALDDAVEPVLAWLETPIGELMIRDPVTADENESLRTVQARMNHSGAGHLPVLSGGRPVGLVTARDLARCMPVPFTVLRRAEIARFLALPVSAVMSRPAITLPADATLEEAVQRMVECKVGSIAVTDPVNGQLLGLITRSTITRTVASLGGRTT